MVSIFLSIAAAAVFAVATVVQHRSASAVPTAGTGAIRLILRLLREPRWLAGKAGDVVGFILHAAALATGSFIVVQSIVSIGVVMTLLLEARLDHRRLALATWVGSVVLLLGVVLLVGVGDPGGGRESAPLSASLPVAIGTAIFMGLALVGTRHRTGATVGVLLATAGGVCFALDASFVRTAGHLIGHEGFSPHFVYAVAGFLVAALAGNILVQRAFQLSSLHVSLPPLTAVQPVASLAFGYVLFLERLRHDGRIGGYLGIVLLAFGVLITQMKETPAGTPDVAPGIAPDAVGTVRTDT